MVGTGGRLDDVREKPFVGLLVVIAPFLTLATMLGVLAPVIVASVGHALQFTKPRRGEGELVLDVADASAVLRVVGKLRCFVVAQKEVLASKADLLPPSIPFVAPEAIPLVC